MFVNNQPLIFGKYLHTYKHFHAYEVKLTEENVVFSLDDISDHHPLVLYQQSHNSTQTYFIVLKYYVLSDYDKLQANI